MKPQFSADLIARQRLLMEREMVEKGLLGQNKHTGLDRGNIFTARCRAQMSANKTVAQYANLPEDQQAAFRQDMAGAQLNPTADGSKANLGARGDKNYAQKLAQAQLTQFDSGRNSALQERVAGKMGLTQAG